MTRIDPHFTVSAPSGATSLWKPPGDDDIRPAAEILARILKYYRIRSGPVHAKGECLRLINGKGPKEVLTALQALPVEWADHAIACVYAVLIPNARRKVLGAYFTPPHLVGHLLERMTQFGLNIPGDKIRDPAAGGAAFLVPLARRMVTEWRTAGMSERKVIASLRRRLHGTEIDKGLAELANALLRRMLVNEFSFTPDTTSNLEIVREADALALRFARRRTDHEIGNPPYRRLSLYQNALMRERFSDIASGRLNLYTIFMRRALDEVPAGGLVGHVVPASFLGGPEFAAFRRRLLELAEVLVVDLIDQRSNVFVDATQDACFVVLRRRNQERPIEVSWASSGTLQANGCFARPARMRLAADGSPWHLPGDEESYTTNLADWGYRASVGYLVPHRQSSRLHTEPGPGRVPLIWAKAVGQDGSFDHGRGLSATRAGWVAAPPDATYVVRDPCVVVQRTSSRDQRRRIVAAAVPKTFLQYHGGIVGENHVIFLVPTRADAPSPDLLAAALNEPRVTLAINRVCGSASIPIGAIQTLRLPPPPPSDGKVV